MRGRGRLWAPKEIGKLLRFAGVLEIGGLELAGPVGYDQW